MKMKGVFLYIVNMNSSCMSLEKMLSLINSVKCTIGGGGGGFRLS